MKKNSNNRLAKNIVRVIGVDPGSVCTGYGIIQTDGVTFEHIVHGHIRTSSEATFPQRLGEIYHALSLVVAQWDPAFASIESVFVGRNISSALKLGQARGAAIAALVKYDLPVSEHEPRLVKQVVSGSGAADKALLLRITRGLLGIDEKVQADAGDALAIAICGARTHLMSDTAKLLRKKPSRHRGGRGLRI